MSGKKCRGLKGFAAGGIVDVPGASRSGVADDIHVDDAPVGGFVLPADSVLALRRSNPELLAQILAVIQQAGGDADGAATAQIAISNGELFIPPEAVAALGGAEVLNAIKDATHQQVNAPAAKPIDAPPPPGGVNAPLDAVVQPPRGLLGVGGAGVLPDAAMPGSGQAQQQRTFFKGGGAVARGLFTGGGLVRRQRFAEGDFVSPDEEEARKAEQASLPTPEQQAASAARTQENMRNPQPQSPIGDHVSDVVRGVQEGWNEGGLSGGAKIAGHVIRGFAQAPGMLAATGVHNVMDTAAKAAPVAQALVSGLTNDAYAAEAPQAGGQAPAGSASEFEKKGAEAVAPTRATPRNAAQQAGTDAPAAAQQGEWQGVGGLSGVARRLRQNDDGTKTWEYSNVAGANGGFASAHDPYKIPDQQAGGAAPASSLVGARVIEASAPVNTISSSAAASPSAATSNALHAARMAAAARGEPTGTEPRGIAGFSAPTVPTMDFYERERVKKAQEEALSAMQARAANTAAKRARGQRIGVAELQAEKDALAGIAGIRAGQLARDDEAAKQNAATAIGMRNAQTQMQRAMAEAQQPRGMSSASGQGAARPLTGKELIEALQAQMLEGAFGAGTPEARSDYAARVASLNRLLGKGGSDDAAKWTALGDGTGRFVNLPGNARPWAIFDPNSVDDETRRR